jgi:hypothetical protein
MLSFVAHHWIEMIIAWVFFYAMVKGKNVRWWGE